MLQPQISNIFHIKVHVLLFCILVNVSINSRTYAKISFILFFRKISHFWHNSGAVATITQPTNILLGRYTAGFLSDNNSWWIFSKVKYWPKYYRWYTILCTHRLQPPRNDCTGRVQWFSSMWLCNNKKEGMMSIIQFWLKTVCCSWWWTGSNIKNGVKMYRVLNSTKVKNIFFWLVTIF